MSETPETVRDVWVYLAADPLLHLTLTLVIYQAAAWVFERSGGVPLLNPVMLSILIIASLLFATGTSYQTYFEGAQFVHFLLGPATVALAIPLYRQFDRVKASALALFASILAGSVTAAGTAVALGALAGGSQDVLTSLAPKSVTAPVAMGITEAIGGLASLTAVLVILTGVLGAMVGPWVLTRMGIDAPAARGVALGTAGHGIATARALEESEVTGAFSGLAMGLNALATAVLLPLIWNLFAG